MPSADATADTPLIDPTELATFHEHLQSCKRVVALCGAGLSAASGLPTFRGAGGFWRTYDAISLASPDAWAKNPGLVWQFYNYRRHMALKAQPNPAHFALARLASVMPNKFLTITQNVDGLSQRAGHDLQTIEFLHGSLFDVKCDGFSCGYVDRNNFTDPIAPALAIELRDGQEEDISSAEIPLRDVNADDLPHCPRCNSLIRPGVVWFGESLPKTSLERVERFLHDRQGIDLIIVIGTSARVWPAAGYIAEARKYGAKVAVVNIEEPDGGAGASALRRGDWFFQGDAGIIIPQILEPLIGRTQTAQT